MRRIAMVGAALLIGYGLPAPADANGVPPVVKATPGCHCPPVHRRVHARVRHYRAALPPKVVAAVAGPDYYKHAGPEPWDPLYDHIMVDHFRSRWSPGFINPRRPAELARHRALSDPHRRGGVSRGIPI